MKYFNLLVLILLSLSSCVKEETGDVGANIHVGTALPSFTVQSPDNEPVGSDILKGKVALIVFFDTGCEDCRRELPKVEEIWKVLGNSDEFALLPVSRGQPAAEVACYWQTNTFTMPVFLDDAGIAYSLFAESVIPRFYLADRKGIIRWIGVEKIEETAGELIQKITGLIKE